MFKYWLNWVMAVMQCILDKMNYCDRVLYNFLHAVWIYPSLGVDPGAGRPGSGREADTPDPGHFKHPRQIGPHGRRMSTSQPKPTTIAQWGPFWPLVVVSAPRTPIHCQVWEPNHGHVGRDSAAAVMADLRARSTGRWTKRISPNLLHVCAMAIALYLTLKTLTSR